MAGESGSDGEATVETATSPGEAVTAAERAEQVLAALAGMNASLDVDQEKHARHELTERDD